jgi:hypothetical protein
MNFFAHTRDANDHGDGACSFSQKNIEIEALDNALNDEEGDVAMVSPHGCYVAINANPLSLGESFQKKSQKRGCIFKKLFFIQVEMLGTIFFFFNFVISKTWQTFLKTY